MAKSPSNIVNKWEWPSLFQKAYDKTVTKANIKAGFEQEESARERALCQLTECF